MDPNWYGSIAGIIVFTIAIVQGLKKWMADSTNVLAQIPTPVYTVAVALLLTAVAHFGLGTLVADQGVSRLFMDALTAALGAAGLFELTRPSNMTKSIADAGKKLTVLLALGLVGLSASGCAKVNPALVAADSAVTTRLTSATGKLRGICANPALAAPCKDVLPLASKSLGVAIEYNRAIAKQEPFKLAALIVSIGELLEGVMKLPQGETAALIDDLAGAIAAARVGGEQ